MILKRLHILLLAFAWCHLQAGTINPVIPESHTYTFQINQYEKQTTSVDNLFIRELAKYNLLGLENTAYSYNYSLSKSVKAIDDYTCKVSYQVQGEGCSGNTFYKGVTIADILEPEKMDAIIHVVDNGNYFISKEFKGVSVDASGKFSADFIFETYDINKDYSLEIENLKFYSDTNDKQVFYQRINTIDNYYAAVEAIADCQKRIENLPPMEEQLINNHLAIVEFQRIYDVLNDLEFDSKVLLNKAQQTDYNSKLEKLGKTIDGQLYFFNKALNEASKYDLNQSIREIASTYVGVSCYFNILSEKTNHANKTYFSHLGSIDFSPLYIDRLHKGLIAILEKSNLKNKKDKIIKELQQEVYKSFIENAEIYIDQKDFYLAKSILENAERYHLATMGSALPLELNVLLSKTDYGIFNSYLHLIDRAIEIGNYKLAEKYLEKARNFQKDNSTSIITDSYLNKVSERLIELYINKGINLNEKEVYDEAIYCFDQAGSICAFINMFNFNYEIHHGLIQARNGYYHQLIDSAKVLHQKGNANQALRFSDQANDWEVRFRNQINPCADYLELKHELIYNVYLSTISRGKKHLNEGNYYQAYDELLKALELEEESDFDVYEPLPDFFAQAAIPYLVDQCKLAGVKVKTNQLVKAKQMYDNCLTLQDAYGLNYEQELMTGLTQLNNDIFNQKCGNVQAEFDRLFTRVNNSIAGNDFISAVEFLDQTALLAAENYFCELDQQLITSYQSEYQPAAEYQQLAQKAQDALNSGSKEDLNQIYNRMEELSSLHEVIRKRIEPLPLHYLFSVKKNLALFEEAVKNFDNPEDYEMGLKVMNTLAANQQIPLNDVKAFQESLAEKLAAHDRKVTASYDPQTNIDKYTGGDSRYKHFTRTYLKTK